MQFSGLIGTRAMILEKTTKQTVSDSGRITVLLKGVLNEFEPVVTNIMSWPEERQVRMTYKEVIAHLKSYAKKHILLGLTKAGNANGRNKRFSVAVGKKWHGQGWMGETDDCQQFLRFKLGEDGCPRTNCRFNHPQGQGGGCMGEKADSSLRWRNKNNKNHQPAANMAN
jgi:hypothetical protein